VRRRLLGTASALFVLLAVGSVGSPGVVRAADRTADVNASTPTATWSESATMSGAAPARRNDMCTAPSHPCDDFTLNVDRGSNTQTKLVIDLTPSANADMIVTVFAPGCDPSVSPACYVAYTTTAVLVAPANGTYLIRMTCNACVNATYSAKATLSAFTYHVPEAGDQSFGWAVQQLPVTDDGLTSYGEPGIWINGKGHEIVNTFGPTVWISTDNGKTWGPPLAGVDPTPCSGLSGDADAVVSEDDTYYADNLCLPGPTNLSYSSTDAGKTWNAGQGGLPSLPGAATDSDRQWYGLDPQNPNVVYFSYHDFEGPNIWVNKSTDHGQTWTQQTPITLGADNFVDTGPGNTSARPLVDPTDPNTVLVFYTSNDAMSSATAPPTNQDFDLNRIYVARSTDGGKTFANTLLYDAGDVNGADTTIAHLFSAAAVDSAGNAYVVFSERKGDEEETHIKLMTLAKGTSKASDPVQVDAGGLGANVMPWVAAGDPGRVAVTWYGSPAKDNDDPDAQWSQMFAQSLNALDVAPKFTQSRVSGPRPMHAADVCLAGTLCLVTGGNRNLSDFQMVSVDPCGYAQMVWTDDATGAGLTMHARQTSGESLRPKACVAGSIVGVTNGLGGASAGSGGTLAATGRDQTLPLRVVVLLFGLALATLIGSRATARR
jgi:hypothetical protein